MSRSTSFSEAAGRFSGRKLPEKSSFTHTCSLLSQYLKEKGSFGDLRLGMTCNPQTKGKSEMMTTIPTTMDLFPKIEISGEVSEKRDNNVSDRNVKPMDLFPPRAVGFTPSVPVEAAQNSADLRGKPRTTGEEAKRTAQMTIIYGGRVLVFDDFPADKAKEIMVLAEKGVVPNLVAAAASAAPPPASASTSDCGNVFPVGNSTTFASTSGNCPPNDRLQRPPQADVSDMPIARKASLHRFLEKRKGRISAKAPYQANVDSPMPSNGNGRDQESKSWLALASMSD